MKRKIPVLIGLAVLALIVFLNACSPVQAEKKLEQFEEKVEQKLDAVVSNSADALPPAEITDDMPDRLTTQQAQEVALTHAGLTAQQVSRLRVQFGIDDRIPQYDVEFYHDGTEYDYEIHAQTGQILSFEKDRN